MRLLHARHADRRAGTARARRRAQAATQSAIIFPATTAAAPAIRLSSTQSNPPPRTRPDTGRKGRLTMNEHAKPLTLSERADELEEQMMHELNESIATKSVLFGMADGKVEMANGQELMAEEPGQVFPHGRRPAPAEDAGQADADRFLQRCASPRPITCCRAPRTRSRTAMNEKIVLACLLHDIGVVGFIRCDHGYWGAQLIEPYVDEEVSWAIRMHQALRFFPDVGRLQISGDVHQAVRRGLPARALHRRGIQARAESQMVHDVAPDHA